MKYFSRIIFVFLFLSNYSVSFSQNTVNEIKTVYREKGNTSSNYYLLVHPKDDIKNIVFLLPGFGNTPEMFLEEIAIEEFTKENNILLVIASPKGRLTHYLDNGSMVIIDEILKEIIKDYSFSESVNIIFVGFSIGGTGATRYSEYFIGGKSINNFTLKGLVLVDPPLDFERFWNSSQRKIAKDFSPISVKESKFMLNILSTQFGGSPLNNYKNYKKISPFLASQEDGGNASLLKKLPILIYTEPDLIWWKENRGIDSEDLNSLDIDNFEKKLKTLGNQRINVIKTKEKGFRKDGKRHPHSWSIVDEEGLLEWITKIFNQ